MVKSQSQGRRALVTGATGFVGSHLVKALVLHGWTVHIVVRPDSKLDSLDDAADRVHVHRYDGSLNLMIAAMSQAAPEVVFHLSSLFIAEHRPSDVEPLISANVLFPTHLLEAMAATGVHSIINTGTAWQHYGDAPYSPVCLYAATKQAFEAIMQYFVEARRFRAITIKLFDTYGPNDQRRKLFSLLAQAAATGELLTMSPGGQLIDLVHIDDVVSAFIAAERQLQRLAHSVHEVYAVSSGAALELREVVALYEKIKKKKLNIAWGAKPYRKREMLQPWSQGKPVPEWRPAMPLSEGLMQL